MQQDTKMSYTNVVLPTLQQQFGEDSYMDVVVLCPQIFGHLVHFVILKKLMCHPSNLAVT